MLNNISDELKKKELQNMFCKLNAGKIILILMCENQEDEEYLSYLLKFLIQLLEGGNNQVQEYFYKIFLTNTFCENFFRRIYNLFTSKTSPSKIQKKNRKIGFSDKILDRTLKFIQLLCGGHYSNMQDYLRYQTISKNSYDIVSSILKYIQSFKINDFNYVILIQSLETISNLCQVKIISIKYILKMLLNFFYKQGSMQRKSKSCY